MSEGLLLEAQRVERTIARIRWAAAALDILLGPFFPNLWLLGVFLLGVTIMAYGLVVLRASGRATSLERHRRIAALSFACDLTVLVIALFLFSNDPGWVTFIIAIVVVMTGAFRFGTVGAWSAAIVSSIGYLAAAAFRQLSFGFVTPPERALFVVSVFGLSALLLDRGLRELRQLRDEREGLITGLQRRVAEDAALEQVMRIVAGIPSADAIVPAVLRASRDVLRFDRATVFVADEELGRYRPLFRLAASAEAEAMPPPRLRLGEGLLGVAMAGGSTLLVRDLLADPRYVPVRPNEEARSVILVPLRVRGRTVAVFSLSRALPDAFGADDVRLAETVAGLVAQVLENERLFAEASRAEALRAADKLKNEFLATISHELRTPITVIGGSLELLAQGRASDTTQLIAQARRHVERLDRTVQDLLDLAHLQEARIELEREYVSPGVLLNEAAAAHAVLASKRGQGIAVADDGAPPLAYVDRRRIQQILGNLVANAVRYAPERSTITLAAAVGDGRLRLTVSDEGPPIPAAERERLFDKFYRRPAHRDEPGGSGLGLAIAKTLAELHGGTVLVEDRAPTGNTFVVELPV
ncbi:MAG TPA: ATP-binding protein [Candidatus Limnocylindria bacterium]|nr:ATP-binding protein [Candidatus Limnocylindria bacterium]